MKIPSDGKLLRIFIGEQDKWHGLPLKINFSKGCPYGWI